MTILAYKQTQRRNILFKSSDLHINPMHKITLENYDQEKFPGFSSQPRSQGLGLRYAFSNFLQ